MASNNWIELVWRVATSSTDGKDHMNEMILQRHYGLVPATMGEAMKLAEMMASAKLVPAALQKSPADCLMVIQQAIRWDMDPFAVAQECSVIQGKLMLSGKLVAAVVNARGNLTDRLSFKYSGSGDDRTITVSGQLQGEDTPRTVEISLKNAKTANSIWQKQPDQQLMYHGARVWARRHTPELVLGVWSEEDFDASSVEHRRPPTPAPNVMIAPANNIDFETGEITQVPPPDDAQAPDVAPIVELARAAARRGHVALREYYKTCSEEDREAIKPFGEELRRLMS
jgi:hypothetical protein